MAVTETIKSNGRELKSGSYHLISFESAYEFNKIPRAELKLSDGSIANQSFDTLDGTDFLPGNEIEVFLKNEGDLATEEKVFEGIVINHELERSHNRSTLTIELSDLAVKMTGTPQNRVFKDETDDRIIKEIITQNAGVQIGEIDETDTEHEQMVQYYATDWDFIVKRARANGLLISVLDGTVSAEFPVISEPILIRTFGFNLDEFNLKLNSEACVKEVSSYSLDTKSETLPLLVSKNGNSPDLGTVNYDLDQLSEITGNSERSSVHGVPSNPAEMNAWSDSQAMSSRLSLVLGTVEINGQGDVFIGQTIKLENVGRFSGEHLITGVHQAYSKLAGWSTHVQIGLDKDWLCCDESTNKKSAGLLPGVSGLQMGSVQGHFQDAENGFRVLVDIPAFSLGDRPDTVLARYTTLDAGVDHGIFFPPQKGDRVVVGFLNDDPRQAVILGSMHTNKRAHEEKKKDEYVGIFTKSNHQLLFDEKKEQVILSTADEKGGNEHTLCIDQKNQLISLVDMHGNQLELNKEGILIKSPGNIAINADGDFGIDAKGKVKIKGKKVDLI